MVPIYAKVFLSLSFALERNFRSLRPLTIFITPDYHMLPLALIIGNDRNVKILLNKKPYLIATAAEVQFWRGGGQS